jgi:hypothetical protein
MKKLGFLVGQWSGEGRMLRATYHRLESHGAGAENKAVTNTTFIWFRGP